jgi:hypothetical protein
MKFIAVFGPFGLSAWSFPAKDETKKCSSFFFFFFFSFNMSVQEGEERFELVTKAL